MATVAEPIAWERLAPPPREVPLAVQTRVRFAEVKKTFNFGSGFLTSWLTFVGLFLIVFGTIWFNGAEEEDHPAAGVFLAGGGIGILSLLTAIIYARGTRKIRILCNGTPAQGTITHVWQNFTYHPYASIVGKWFPFAEKLRAANESSAGSEWMLSLAMSVYRHAPCKVRIQGDNGRQHELKMRVDLFNVLIETGVEPRVEVLCDPASGHDGIVTSDFYPELTLTPDGHWTVKKSARFLVFVAAFLRCAVPVVGTYLSAALGMTLFGGGIPAELMIKLSSLGTAGIVVLFTVTHAVLPVFFFRLFLDSLKEFGSRISPGRQGQIYRIYLGAFRAFITLFIGLWFGLPIAVLAYLTGWLSLAWAAVHLAVAQRGTRLWVFIEYGSTSLALLLFVVCFSGERFFPWGIIVIILQALLLTILDWKAREKWMPTQELIAMASKTSAPRG